MKIIKYIIAITFLLLTTYGISIAAGENKKISDGANQVQNDCFSGKEQYGSFIRSFLGFSDFVNVVKDIQMNGCQFTEVKRLKDELENLREKIKDSFYRCDSKEATQLRMKYNRLEAELFFVRNIVITQKAKRIPADINVLKTKMYKMYVKNLKYFKDGEGKPEDKRENFDTVFANFTVSHDPKDFEDCKEDVAAIIEAVKNVKTTIEGIIAAIKKEAVSLKDTADDLKDKNAKDSTGAELKLSAEEIFAKSINQVSPQRFASDFMREIDMQTISKLDLQKMVEDDEVRYKLDMERARKEAHYRAKYQFTSGPISEDYHARSLQLIDTLNHATDSLNTTNECFQHVIETQCSESA